MARTLALALTALVTLLAGSASAYPTKSIELVVPFPAGGRTDIIARQFAAIAYLVSAPTPDEAVRQVANARAQGYSAFKVKVGGHAAAHDVDVVRAVVEAAGGGTVWADANQGYDVAEARTAARGFEPLGVPVFEQPLAATDWRSLAELRRATSMKVAIDEAAMSLPVVAEMLRQELADVVVIKVAKLGGLHHVRAVVDLCRDAGVMLLGSGLMDAPITLAAGLHAFAAAGITYPCDLNGPQFLAEDYLAEPMPIVDGTLTVPDRAGLGWEPAVDRIQRFRI